MVKARTVAVDEARCSQIESKTYHINNYKYLALSIKSLHCQIFPIFSHIQRGLSGNRTAIDGWQTTIDVPLEGGMNVVGYWDS